MKKTHILALILIAVTIGGIVVLSDDYTTYETFTSALKKPNKEFHVVGTLVKEKELYYDPQGDANFFSFYMLDQDSVEQKVVFAGTKPQDFERSEQIVITGHAGDEAFVASKILMKCPSKYVDDELEIREVTAQS